MLIRPTVKWLRTLGLLAMAVAIIKMQNSAVAAELSREWLGLLVEREDQPDLECYLILAESRTRDPPGIIRQPQSAVRARPAHPLTPPYKRTNADGRAVGKVSIFPPSHY